LLKKLSISRQFARKNIVCMEFIRTKNFAPCALVYCHQSSVLEGLEYSEIGKIGMFSTLECHGSASFALLLKGSRESR